MQIHACRVLGPTCTQAAVFAAVSDVVQSALDGYHVCLFSYGQTGSGKTHTMNGVPGDETQRGVIPRAVSKILENAERLKLTGWEFALEATFIEIYNENLRDLLGTEGNGRAGRPLEGSCIKHNAHGHTEVRTWQACAEPALLRTLFALCMLRHIELDSRPRIPLVRWLKACEKAECDVYR